ncbi:MAG TPA: myo-inositol-1-phosphate synthase [Planctomycetes bacterium]|nr:myo-inositol-1-phosphate synthase [Planctomycetaceae bacterium]HIM29323.1 myo-inositol-1-phosphate synthase [Planctomycetota bacterium]
MARRRVGLWLLGARGGVATTAIVGWAAMKKKLTPPVGLVSELPQFSNLDFFNWGDLTIGGHDIRKTTLIEEAEKLRDQSRAIDGGLIRSVRTELRKIDERIRPGVLFNVGSTIRSFATKSLQKKEESPRQSIRRVQRDLRAFVKNERLDQVIVLNVASTEPQVKGSIPAKWDDFESLLEDGGSCPLPASSLYAIASLELGMPFVNFTPSLGSAPAAIDELARRNNTCHMGHDGKTGETLLKSALAPIFANRHLNIMSWVGHNIFGNMDGKVLDDPRNKKTKVVSKDRLLGEILGYDPQTHISIEYIESLGDWKTAWDHVHFQGFLGTPMALQFTWQGCDSILAAPLVLDLVRFTDLARRRGETGLLTFLASFFKSPLGTTQNNFVKQFQMLEDWAAATGD